MLKSATLSFLSMLFLSFSFHALFGDKPEEFTNFIKKYNKTFTSSQKRYKDNIFFENKKLASYLQFKNPYATFGVNEFSDLSPEEFKIRHNSQKFYQIYKMLPKTKTNFIHSNSPSISGIDWRNYGAVTRVKNQGNCGSCWSFSAIGNIEGQWYMAGYNVSSLSEQELVSCDTIDNGCDGGLPVNAFLWLQQANGGYVSSYNDYPYVSGDGNVPACSLSSRNNTRAQICGYHELPNDENAMASWLSKHGPISIGVDATSWQYYISGILTNCISEQVDHAVLLVGFNNTHNPPYWIIKNSWGTNWGENGYIRVEKGTNQCLLTTAPSSAIVC
jgi:cysteine peptidase B